MFDFRQQKKLQTSMVQCFIKTFPKNKLYKNGINWHF